VEPESDPPHTRGRRRSRCRDAVSPTVQTRSPQRPLHDGFFAQSADIALQRIREAAGDSLILILSDINMPGMSGLELLPIARAARPDVPVIMITAYGDAETERKALEGGAEALLTKPIDFVALRCAIDSRVARAA
jgi:CheY-like chemotaxis protein